MGMTEDAQLVELKQRQDAIEKARLQTKAINGPALCVRCERPNDRRLMGYAVCKGCMEAAR